MTYNQNQWRGAQAKANARASNGICAHLKFEAFSKDSVETAAKAPTLDQSWTLVSSKSWKNYTKESANSVYFCYWTNSTQRHLAVGRALISFGPRSSIILVPTIHLRTLAPSTAKNLFPNTALDNIWCRKWQSESTTSFLSIWKTLSTVSTIEPINFIISAK